MKDNKKAIDGVWKLYCERHGLDDTGGKKRNTNHVNEEPVFDEEYEKLEYDAL